MNNALTAAAKPFAHTIGCKYEQTKDLRTTEIAKLIRKDIAAAIKAGALPKVTVSVRCSRSGFTGAVSVIVTDAPFCVVNPERVVMDRTCQSIFRMNADGSAEAVLRHSDVACKALETIKKIVAAYNFDNSDLMTDYFHVRFYETVDFASELEMAHRARIVAALDGRCDRHADCRENESLSRACAAE